MFKGITKGVDLTHPKASAGYVINGVIAVVVIIAVIAIGMWVYSKTVAKAVSGLGTAGGSVAASLAPGTFGDGS